MITADNVRKIMIMKSDKCIKEYEKHIELNIKEKARNGFDYTSYGIYGMPERLLKLIIKDLNDSGFNTNVVKNAIEQALYISWKEDKE